MAVITDESHYLALAAAYVRGVVGELYLEDAEAIARGERDGLRLHRFKRSSRLPRVRAVLGALRGFGARSHVQLFDGERLAAMFRAAGARRVSIDHVLNHLVAVAVR